MSMVRRIFGTPAMWVLRLGDQDAHRSLKSLKTLEFHDYVFKALKILEFLFRPCKAWNFGGISGTYSVTCISWRLSILRCLQLSVPNFFRTACFHFLLATSQRLLATMSLQRRELLRAGEGEGSYAIAFSSDDNMTEFSRIFQTFFFSFALIWIPWQPTKSMSYTS